MSFGAELVARVLGLPELPFRRISRAIGAGLLAAAIAFPVTFRHGLELYAQHQAQQFTRRFIDPVLERLAPAPTTAPTPSGAGHKAPRR